VMDGPSVEQQQLGEYTMYQRDCNLISHYATTSPDALYDIIEFTLCTINMPLSRVHTQRLSIREHGIKSKWVSSAKALGITYAQEHKAELHTLMLNLKEVLNSDPYADLSPITGINAAQAAVDLFMRIPSIGMVKAGFISQMCGFEVACLDRHNIRMLGLSETALLVSKKIKPELRLKKIYSYVELCRQRGAEYWWDTWCNYVAEKGGMNKSLPTGDAVSAYHVTTIMEM